MKSETDSQKAKEATHLNRLPDLANPVLRFDFAEEIKQLREKESWQRESGRSSKTLVKQQDFRIVLILMKANTEMGEHSADGRVSIQCVSGRCTVHVHDHKLPLSAGQLLALDCGVRHDVAAVEESAILLTISWPKDYEGESRS